VAPAAALILRDCPRDHSARYWVTRLAERFAQAVSWNLRVPLHFATRESIFEFFPANEFDREERALAGGGPFNNRLFIFRRKPGV
ncbi:MAG: hypothetical protein M3Y86_12695, partial [Verrucomicrobiota bacterium]|nr:hypothetical protein [Verrucomicrobiota bacterium]